MDKPEVVTRAEWLEARRAHLAREKELTRLRDQISAERRRLPWVEVTEDYQFDGPDGRESLADLFAGAYHLLDLVPGGRDEDDLDYTMSWLRLRDSY